jgi:hypothetical protein
MDTCIRNVSFLNSIVKCRAQNKFLARQSAAAPAKKSAGTETLGIGVMEPRRWRRLVKAEVRSVF